MIVCVDVDYRADSVVAAAIAFVQWNDGVSARETILRRDAPAAPYEPGRFYERELPYLVDAIARMPPAEVVLVDGYVWLGPGRPGLGAHLHALDASRAVIGVAKTAFAGAEAIELVRGSSAKPLYITAAGMSPQDAARHVRAMHGPFRIPTMIALADALCRAS